MLPNHLRVEHVHSVSDRATCGPATSVALSLGEQVCLFYISFRAPEVGPALPLSSVGAVPWLCLLLVCLQPCEIASTKAVHEHNSHASQMKHTQHKPWKERSARISMLTCGAYRSQKHRVPQVAFCLSRSGATSPWDPAWFPCLGSCTPPSSPAQHPQTNVALRWWHPRSPT